MFAIAILDKQTQEVVLVRDRLGIKPIYLYQKNNIIAIFGDSFTENIAIEKKFEYSNLINQKFTRFN